MKLTIRANNMKSNKYNLLSTATFALPNYTNKAYSIFTDGTHYYIGGWKAAQELGLTRV